MQISNILDLYELERQIKREMIKYDLDDILFSLRTASDPIKPFLIAGTCLFTIRHARAPIALKSRTHAIPRNHLEKILDLVSWYLLADPFSFDPQILEDYHGSGLIPFFIRVAGNQFLFEDDIWGQYGRSLILFRNIPLKLATLKVKKFNISSKFFDLNKISLIEFIVLGFTLHAAALSNPTFTGAYFQKARDQGINLPADDVIEKGLDQFAAGIKEIQEMYEKYKQPNRNYAAYDFNPLKVYPVFRPWTKSTVRSLSEERFMAPLPQLILGRMSEGIYLQMAHAYKTEFTEYFGLLFESYVGEVLQNSFSLRHIISEKEIRKTYAAKKGKVPDWIVFDNNVAVLIECKATGLSQKAISTGDMTAIDYSVEQLIKGLIQIHEFKHACQTGAPGLEKLHRISKIKLLVVTYELFPIINSVLFREIINQRLEAKLNPKGIQVSEWNILSLGELEKLQPHLKASIGIDVILDKLQTEPFPNVIEFCHSKTGKTYQDCFLYNMDMELYRRLGI